MRRLLPLLAVLFAATLPLGCTTLQQVANLRSVKFDLDSASNVTLAGVRMDRIRSYNDLGPIDIARLGAAVLTREAPLALTLNVGADNPGDNPVGARIVAFDWTLMLDDKETISGAFNEEVFIGAGQRATIPLQIRLDLFQFFGSNTRQLVDLAAAIAGQEGVSTRVKLVARPSINTPVGPIRYPTPITIVSRSVGSTSTTGGR